MGKGAWATELRGKKEKRYHLQFQTCDFILFLFLLFDKSHHTLPKTNRLSGGSFIRIVRNLGNNLSQ